MNNGTHKNWYLLWVATLLLLTLGKVYEWAYPSFQHDIRHDTRNQISKKLEDFIDEEQKHSSRIQQLLQVQDSQTLDHNAVLQYMLQQQQIKLVLYEDQKPLFWSGPETFGNEQWATPGQYNGLSIFQHLGRYYMLKKIQFRKAGKNYALVQYKDLNSSMEPGQDPGITLKPQSKSALAIFHPQQPKQILAYVHIDATYLSPFYGNILIGFYLILLFLFYLPFHYFSKKHYSRANFPWGNLILLTGILLTASLCQWIVHQNDFYHSVLTDKLIRTKFYNYTLFEFSVFSCLFFHLSYFFYKYAQFSELTAGKFFSHLIVFANYLISILALVVYCFIFSAVFIHSEFYFDLSNIFSFGLQHYILLFDLLVVLIALFLLTNKLTKSTYSFQFDFRKRLLMFFISLIITIPLVYQSKLELGLLSFYIAAAIIIWMQDFFTEDYQKNILWLISWIIVISILNSSLIFHFQNEKKRYIKNLMLESYVGCVEEKKADCLADLIQNCSANQYDFYYFEDRLLKFSSNVFKPNYKHGIALLGKDSIRHLHFEGKDVLYFKPDKDQLFILSNRLESSLKGISLFSYLFTILIIISYGISLLNQKFNFLPEDLQISYTDKPSLKNRIQFYVILGIVISFLIIAITTVFFTKRSENDIYQENLISKTRNLSNFLESSMRSVTGAEDAVVVLRTQLKQSSQMVDFQLRFFHPDGKEDRWGARQDQLNLEKEFLNPNFYFKYPEYAEDIVVLETEKLKFSAFRNLMYNNNRVGILQVEALTSNESSYSTRLANLVNTLLNIYVFLFLIAASLATLLANSITSPLVTLADKLRRIRLGKTNENLEWKSQDEIGELIQNYNQMVNQLDESARLLAQSERDSAWREMAKQVAHEIKNPLTPMKLSIQYLQQTLRSGTEDIKEMAQKVCHTLIEQIDSLSKIATEFSNFAKMPQAENEKLVLNDLLSSVHDLFRKREDLDIHLSVPIDELYVYADKVQIIRVLNNLINNAIQAIPESRRGFIIISLDAPSKNAVICVQDNGSGIPEDMQSKVFLPNFTSKSSGTGLGLAMCQQIIEAANGRIYFQTVPGKGTRFFVELPLMRPETSGAKNEEESPDTEESTKF